MEKPIFAKTSGVKRLFIILIFFFALTNLKAQILTLEELLSYPAFSQDKIETELKAKGWETHHVEFVTDSNLVRRSWIISNKYNDLKSYVQLYDFMKDAHENNISYQFSDRKTFESYRDQLKKAGFKELTKKKKKKKNEDKNIYKEKEELYFSEKKNSLITLKEVFVYGMNAFVIYSFVGDSRTAKDLMSRDK